MFAFTAWNNYTARERTQAGIESETDIGLVHPYWLSISPVHELMLEEAADDACICQIHITAQRNSSFAYPSFLGSRGSEHRVMAPPYHERAEYHSQGPNSDNWVLNPEH